MSLLQIAAVVAAVGVFDFIFGVLVASAAESIGNAKATRNWTNFASFGVAHIIMGVMLAVFGLLSYLITRG